MFLSVFDIFKGGRRPLLVAHDGTDGGRGPLPRPAPGKPVPCARAAGLAARQPRLHRRGPCDRPGDDPGPRGVRARQLRCGARRGGAGRDPRHRPDRGAGPRAAPVRPREGSGLRLRSCPAGPCQRDAHSGDRRTGRRAAVGGLLFRGRWLRPDRGRACGIEIRPPRRRSRRPLPLRECAPDARDGRGLGPVHRGDEARQRTRGPQRARARPRAEADLAGDERLHRARHGDRRHAAGRPACPPPRQGHPRGAAGRTRAEHDRAAHDQRLDEPLCHGGERGECRRRSGGHSPDQRRGGRGARRHPLLARSCSGGEPREARGFPP